MTNGTKNQYLIPFIVLTSLFFMWGFITVLVDSLIPRLKEIFELSYFQAGLVQFAFFTPFLLISIPAGGLMTKIGYKQGMVIALVIMGVGSSLFWPAASFRLFPVFLLAYFILAMGIAVLQVAANPFVAVLGPEETASSRLNLSQAFNSLGTTIAPLIGAKLILSDQVKNSEEIAALDAAAKTAYFNAEATAVQSPFLFLALSLVLLSVLVLLSKLPKLLATNSTGDYALLFRKKKLMYGALAIFLYVGAEVAIGSYLTNYFIEMNMAGPIKESSSMSQIVKALLGEDLSTVSEESIVGEFVAFYWGAAMIGRFIGSLLNRVVKPAKVLTIAGSGAISLIIISMVSTGFLSMWSILLVGLFNSIMFPTIFTEAIEGLGEYKPRGSGILCTAIFGGAIIPPLYGLLTDNFGFKFALILLIGCYGYIAWYAASSYKFSNA